MEYWILLLTDFFSGFFDIPSIWFRVGFVVSSGILRESFGNPSGTPEDFPNTSRSLPEYNP